MRIPRHAPEPVELDDVVSHESALYRIVSIIKLRPEDEVDALCEVEWLTADGG